jgi:hypothetical protein
VGKHNSQMRHRVQELMKLRKERFCKIKFSSHIPGVPVFTPPALITVNRKWNILRVEREKCFLAGIAFSIK